MRQVIIGFATEGSTDERFLRSIIQRSFEDVAFECSGQVEILPVEYIQNTPDDFDNLVKNCALTADKLGVMVLCIHVDAGEPTDARAFTDKITPAFTAVENIADLSICKKLVAIVPVQMIEAWMLCDKELLKAEIGTQKSNTELGLDKHPESYGNPKQTIADAIRIARQDMTKRRRRDLTISELYMPVGQKATLTELEKLPSYQKFKEEIRLAFGKLNYLS